MLIKLLPVVSIILYWLLIFFLLTEPVSSRLGKQNDGHTVTTDAVVQRSHSQDTRLIAAQVVQHSEWIPIQSPFVMRNEDIPLTALTLTTRRTTDLISLSPKTKTRPKEDQFILATTTPTPASFPLRLPALPSRPLQFSNRPQRQPSLKPMKIKTKAQKRETGKKKKRVGRRKTKFSRRKPKANKSKRRRQDSEAEAVTDASEMGDEMALSVDIVSKDPATNTEKVNETENTENDMKEEKKKPEEDMKEVEGEEEKEEEDSEEEECDGFDNFLEDLGLMSYLLDIGICIVGIISLVIGIIMQIYTYFSVYKIAVPSTVLWALGEWSDKNVPPIVQSIWDWLSLIDTIINIVVLVPLGDQLNIAGVISELLTISNFIVSTVGTFSDLAEDYLEIFFDIKVDDLFEGYGCSETAPFREFTSQVVKVLLAEFDPYFNFPYV